MFSNVEWSWARIGRALCSDRLIPHFRNTISHASGVMFRILVEKCKIRDRNKGLVVTELIFVTYGRTANVN